MEQAQGGGAGTVECVQWGGGGGGERVTFSFVVSVDTIPTLMQMYWRM